MTDHCRSCGAEIIWVTDQDGTRLPLNKRRVRIYLPPLDGTTVCKSTLKGGRLKAGESSWEPVLFHISHFITCPEASSHSKGGK